MIDLPTTFEAATTALQDTELSSACQEAIEQLAEAGYEVHHGLSEDYAAQIAVMAQEPSIKEYCPKDSSERFADKLSTEKWLAKKRAAFLLLKKSDGGHLELAGYGWSGAGSSQHAPGGETTFAIRIGNAVQGQGLATPFSKLVVFGSAEIYGLKNFWLETWASNGGAVHVYQKLGFVQVAEVESMRPTADGKQVAETRLFMTLDNELLP